MKRFRIFILVSRFKTTHIWKLPKSLQGQWANYSVSFFPSIVLVWIFSKGFRSKINWASWCWDNEEASTRSSQTANTLLQQPRGMRVPTDASGVYPRLFKNSREETRDTLCHSLLSPASVLSYQQIRTNLKVSIPLLPVPTLLSFTPKNLPANWWHQAALPLKPVLQKARDAILHHTLRTQTELQ